MLLARGETLATAGRNDEALAAYRQVLATDDAIPGQRSAAEEAIKRLGGELP